MQCLFPYYIDNPAYPHSSADRQIPVPCGRCPNCLKRRVSQWSFRLMHELRCHSSAHFVTLTYDPDHITVTDNGFMTLVKSDYQKFVKRLRKAHCVSDPLHRIKYYAAGEYGSDNHRPHYHAIIFGSTECFINESWDLGYVHIGTVSEASVAYTLKYISKGRVVPSHKRDDRCPEFSLMSKGMGLNFITPAIKAYYQMHPLQCFVVNASGFRISMPRYYKERIFDDFTILRQNFENARRLEEVEDVAKQTYFDEFGTLDGFYSMLDERKLQCVSNFKRNLLKRRL